MDTKEELQQKLDIIRRADRLEHGCPVCGGAMSLVWNTYLGWMLRCDICETTLGDIYERHWNREESLQHYNDHLKKIRELLKKALREEVAHGDV